MTRQAPLTGARALDAPAAVTVHEALSAPEIGALIAAGRVAPNPRWQEDFGVQRMGS